MVDEEMAARLSALGIDGERPILVVDVDEVIVGLAGHLAEFAEEKGYALRLTGYRLDGALRRGDGTEASAAEFRAVFTEFFKTQARHQRAYPDVAETLRKLKDSVQIVILTNVPAYAEAARIDNLRGHGIDYPLVVNQGGKGRVLAWLDAQTSGRVAFIDDSPSQIASASKYAAEVVRLHFVGDASLRRMVDPVPEAQFSPESWREIGEILGSVFGIDG